MKPAAFHREADAEFIEALQHYADISRELSVNPPTDGVLETNTWLEATSDGDKVWPGGRALL